MYKRITAIAEVIAIGHFLMFVSNYGLFQLNLISNDIFAGISIISIYCFAGYAILVPWLIFGLSERNAVSIITEEEIAAYKKRDADMLKLIYEKRRNGSHSPT